MGNKSIFLKSIWVLIFALVVHFQGYGQMAFGDRCEGHWRGVMQIYQKGQLRDSVPVTLSVEKMENKKWRWETNYLSAQNPLTKNYQLILEDSTIGRYAVDEGGGVVLYDYLFGNKLYAVFETHDIFLTSTYELHNEYELIFEVTAGKKIQGKPGDEVQNYSVESLQRVIFRRSKN